MSMPAPRMAGLILSKLCSYQCEKIVAKCAKSVTKSVRHYDIPLYDQLSPFIRNISKLSFLRQNAVLSATLTCLCYFTVRPFRGIFRFNPVHKLFGPHNETMKEIFPKTLLFFGITLYFLPVGSRVGGRS